MDFVLVAQRVPRPRTYIGNAIQIGTDILLYLGHYTLEAEGLERRESCIVSDRRFLVDKRTDESRAETMTTKTAAAGGDRGGRGGRGSRSIGFRTITGDNISPGAGAGLCGRGDGARVGAYQDGL